MLGRFRTVEKSKKSYKAWIEYRRYSVNGKKKKKKREGGRDDSLDWGSIDSIGFYSLTMKMKKIMKREKKKLQDFSAIFKRKYFVNQKVDKREGGIVIST